MQFFGPASVLSAMRLPSQKAFAIGSVDVYWQGILLAAAIIAMILLTQLEAKRKRLPDDTTADLCLALIPCGLIGARIWYVLANYGLYANSFLEVFRFWDGGLALYGAVIFAALGLFVYSLKKKTSFPRLLDTLTPGLMLAMGIQMWGDFFNQTGFGPEITVESRMWFPFAVLIERTDTIHYAAFFYEFIWCILIFAFVWFFLRTRAKRDGAVFLWSILLYCAGHAAFNGLRGERAVFGPLGTVQLICILFALGAGLLLLLQSKKPLPAPVVEASASGDSASDDVPDLAVTDGGQVPNVGEISDQATVDTPDVLLDADPEAGLEPDADTKQAEVITAEVEPEPEAGPVEKTDPGQSTDAD